MPLSLRRGRVTRVVDARRCEPAGFGVDALLRLGMLGCDRVDLLADIGQAIALAETDRGR